MIDKDEMPDSAPAGLIDHARKRTLAFIAKLKAAMATIELEIDQNEGLYPFNGGRLTQAEVCRRAGVSNIALQGPTHKATTKKVVDDWLLRVRAASVTGKKSVRREVSSRAEAWKAQHAAIAHNYHKAELEMIDLRKRIKALEAQNGALLEQLALVDRSKVIPLPTRGK